MLALPAGSELAGYRIEAVAGRGGMGTVYRATDIALDRPVALKLIADEFAGDAEFRERFKRESRLAALIRHPHVVTVFRAGEQDGRLYIAMDYVEGSDLKTLLDERGALEPTLAAKIIWQVASALDAAHAKAMVHRDVKPANVLLAGECEGLHAYLTDFGLTKLTGSATAMTQTGTLPVGGRPSACDGRRDRAVRSQHHRAQRRDRCRRSSATGIAPAPLAAARRGRRHSPARRRGGPHAARRRAPLPSAGPTGPSRRPPSLSCPPPRRSSRWGATEQVAQARPLRHRQRPSPRTPTRTRCSMRSDR